MWVPLEAVADILPEIDSRESTMNVNGSESLNDVAGHGNQSLFDRAKKLIPGGVNSPVRAFGSVGGTPRFIRSAKGCRILDEDNR